MEKNVQNHREKAMSTSEIQERGMCWEERGGQLPPNTAQWSDGRMIQRCHELDSGMQVTGFDKMI